MTYNLLYCTPDFIRQCVVFAIVSALGHPPIQIVADGVQISFKPGKSFLLYLVRWKSLYAYPMGKHMVKSFASPCCTIAP